MKIKISKDVKPKLSDDEYKYLLLLEFYDDFISEIERLQKLFKKGKIHLTPSVVPVIMEKYHVPINFIDPIESLIMYGKILQCNEPISIFDIRSQFNRRMLYNEDLEIYPPPNKLMGEEYDNLWYENNKSITREKGIEFALPLIKINRRMNKTELFKQIKLKWPEIEDAFKYYEKSDDMLLTLQPISTREIGKMIQIYRLRKTGIRSLDIGLQFNLGTQTIRSYCSDMKKLLISLGFIKK